MIINVLPRASFGCALAALVVKFNQLNSTLTMNAIGWG